MPTDPIVLEEKRKYRAKKAEDGFRRLVVYIPGDDKTLIEDTQMNRALRTQGHALSAILEEWREMKETLNQENAATS